MQCPRKGETHPPSHVRTTRYYKVRNYWYYNTREGAPIGPFDKLTEAIKGCQDYLEYLEQAPCIADILAANS